MDRRIGRYMAACLGTVLFALPLAFSAQSQGGPAPPQVAPTTSEDITTDSSITSPCTPNYCGKAGQSVFLSWHYPNCGTGACGKETWYVKGLPSSVATYTISPKTTTLENSAKITFKIAAKAKPGIYHNIELGATCSDGLCLPATVILTVEVKPTIKTVKGETTAWWFNGQKPAKYPMTIKLTASPAGLGSYTWNITGGGGYAQFTDGSSTFTSSGDTAEVEAKAAPPKGQGNVTVTVTATFQTSKPATVSVRVPYSLKYLSSSNSSNKTLGYNSKITYKILDQFGKTLPYSVPVNENFTPDSLVNDFAGTNWPEPPACGSTGVCATVKPSSWSDLIQGEPSTDMPKAQSPRKPLGTTKVDHWTGELSVGSGQPGSGVEVQTNTWQRFQDHATHTNIVSPP